MAEHAALAKDLEKNKGGVLGQMYPIQAQELKARLALARGESLHGLGLLAEAAQKQFEFQQTYADPPFYPEVIYNSLGEAYLTTKSPLLAAEAFEKALTLTHNDLFALSGMVRAYAAAGERAKAQDAMARLLFVAADADAGVEAVARAKATGITATPRDSSPADRSREIRSQQMGAVRSSGAGREGCVGESRDARTVSREERAARILFGTGMSTLHAAAARDWE